VPKCSNLHNLVYGLDHSDAECFIQHQMKIDNMIINTKQEKMQNEVAFPR
jgi:hypothetical protein